MWKCPVCDQENTAATVCPRCGYDQTCDYERYPTAFAVKGAKPTHPLRREWRAKQNPPVNGRNRKRTVTVTQEQAAQGCRVTAGYVDGQRLEITVSAGTKDGSVLRCRGLGQPGSNGGKNGDLLVTVRVQKPLPEPDGLYDAPKDPPVKGGDLRATVTITPDQAARGCQLRVTPSGGSAHQVTIPGACTDGRTMRYTGLGQPGSNGGKNGDLLITVRVQERAPAAQPPEKASLQVRLKPGEAAQGCTKSISFKHNGKKVRLTLFIPAGVVYGQKLHYPRVRADDGTLYDVTAGVKVRNFLASKIFYALGIYALGLNCILMAVHEIPLSFTMCTSALETAATLFLIGWVIQKITDSRSKKKYGPKTPEEKERCQTPREMPPQR